MTEDGGPSIRKYKFQNLEVYNLALNYLHTVYTISKFIPDKERFNLRNQMERAATSIVLNIAEGSTGQTNAEQNRFLGLAIRSYLETVACCDIIIKLSYLTEENLADLKDQGHILFIKLSAFRKALRC